MDQILDDISKLLKKIINRDETARDVEFAKICLGLTHVCYMLDKRTKELEK